MKLLVIGLGSMGKRRIRNFQKLGFAGISGFDLREDRRRETHEKYGVEIFTSLEDALLAKPDALVISVPPDKHSIYMEKAVELNLPFFVEASVLDEGYDQLISKINEQKLVAAPSGTMFFHPAIRKIFELVNAGALGKITHVSYHSGQYLPDWHSYEAVSEFYVSKKETGGAREIVPFELTWITKLFGFPSSVVGTVKKTMHIEGAELIDDTYNLLFDYDTFTFNLVVDVVSRAATRRLLINGAEKQLYWNWEENSIRVFSPANNAWENYDYSTAPGEEGYNANITEQMYLDEQVNFIEAIARQNSFFNTMEDDHRVLRLLYAAERSAATGCFQKTV